MKYPYLVKKIAVIFIVLFNLLITTKQGFSQLIYQPYSYQFYQKLNTVEYSPVNRSHTSLKPYFIADSSTIRHIYDSLMISNINNAGKSWLYKVLFRTHSFETKTKDYSFYLDYLTDLQVGHEFEGKRSTTLNTRGYELEGTIGPNFFFYTSGYENQGAFVNYEMAYIDKTGMVPGQAYGRNTTYSTSADWSYVTSLIGYRPNKAITIAMGEDKTFIGDGYRSILLSDYASAYPLLRLTADISPNVQYMAMWAYMEDRNAVQFNAFQNFRRKWGAFHYIDWNINNKASLGFFNALITEEANDQGNGHGFDINYINPLLFVSSLGPSSQAPDHTLLGLNAKYKVLNKTTVYGQFLYDQETSAANNSKYAWQLGFRGADLFKVKSLNYIVEFNTAAPYTYSSPAPIVNYSELNEPLADPLGGNFKEWLGIINYSVGKFDFQGQFDYAVYGLDVNNINYGKDINLANNINIPSGNGATGQGLNTTLKYAEGTVSYVINPRQNLRIEMGGLFREEKNSQTITKTFLVTFGLRSSFRNLYHDF